MCILLCLDYAGEKADLAARRIDGLCDLKVIKEAARKEEEEEDDELENDDDGSEAENSRQDENIGGQPPARKADCQFSFHFKDIENTVRQFDGSTELSIRRWIDEFEETAALLK